MGIVGWHVRLASIFSVARHPRSSMRRIAAFALVLYGEVDCERTWVSRWQDAHRRHATREGRWIALACDAGRKVDGVFDGVWGW